MEAYIAYNGEAEDIDIDEEITAVEAVARKQTSGKKQRFQAWQVREAIMWHLRRGHTPFSAIARDLRAGTFMGVSK
jgi:predicted RNA-binding protein associated with RNAse of E/G family